MFFGGTDKIRLDEQDTPIRHDLVPDDIPTVNGYAEILTKPGLGIEVSDEAIEFYRCDNY